MILRIYNKNPIKTKQKKSIQSYIEGFYNHMGIYLFEIFNLAYKCVCHIPTFSVLECNCF